MAEIAKRFVSGCSKVKLVHLVLDLQRKIWCDMIEKAKLHGQPHIGIPNCKATEPSSNCTMEWIIDWGCTTTYPSDAPKRHLSFNNLKAFIHHWSESIRLFGSFISQLGCFKLVPSLHLLAPSIRCTKKDLRKRSILFFNRLLNSPSLQTALPSVQNQPAE